MAAELQQIKTVSRGYRVSYDDLGFVLEVSDSVFMPELLPGGFYVTLVNIGSTSTTIFTPGSVIRSPNGGAALTVPYQTVTLYRRTLSTEWICGQL